MGQDAASSDSQTFYHEFHCVGCQQRQSDAMASDLNKDSGETVPATTITTPMAQAVLCKEPQLPASHEEDPGDAQSFDSKFRESSELTKLKSISELQSRLRDAEKDISSLKTEDVKKIIEDLKTIQEAPPKFPQRRLGLPGNIQICLAGPVSSPVTISTSHDGPSPQDASIRYRIHAEDEIRQVAVSTPNNCVSSQYRRVSRGPSVRTPQAGAIQIVALNTADLRRTGEERRGEVTQLAGRIDGATLCRLSARCIRNNNNGDREQSSTLFLDSGAVLSKRVGGNTVRRSGTMGEEAHLYSLD
ncbi:hypothetical protein GGI35DRAFT_463029, partial [Trichoderma velutinum]